MRQYNGQTYMIKKVNKNLIIEVIRKKGPISMPEISKFTDLSLPTVHKTVRSLVNKSVVKKAGYGESIGAGRKPLLYEFNADSAYVISIFIKDDQIQGALSDLLGSIITEKSIPIMFDSGDQLLNIIIKLINSLKKDISNSKNIRAIGLGVPGVVDNKGSVHNIPNLSDWEGLKLKDIIEEKYNVPVFLENDVNLTTLGIYYNDLKKEYENVVYAYFGKGTGLGLILNKRLFKSRNNFAGEISYMITEDVDSQTLLNKKTKGLFEDNISNLINNIIKNKEVDDLLQLKKYTEENEIENDNEIICLANSIAYSLINIICMIDPEVIVIEGNFIGRKFLGVIKDIIYSYLDLQEKPQILLQNNDKAGLIGTIKLCLSNIDTNYLLVNKTGL